MMMKSVPSWVSAAGGDRCQVSLCGNGKYLFYVNTEKINSVALVLWRDLSVYIMQRKQPAKG